jgi:hypothetical protein
MMIIGAVFFIFKKWQKGTSPSFTSFKLGRDANFIKEWVAKSKNMYYCEKYA